MSASGADVEASGRAGRLLPAVAETVAVAGAYIALSLSAVGTFDLSFVFPHGWAPEIRSTGSGFLTGAIVQGLLVLAGAYLLGLADLRRAIAATVARSTFKAWTIAVAATAIHAGTIVLVVVPQPELIWEASSINLILSAVPAADGWTQEVLFRGYVMLRLARGGMPVLGQILASGALFASIHIGYAGAGTWDALSPLIGTFMLGSFFGWAVHSGRGSLKPVVVCHMLIIIVAQPWLALAT